MCDTMGVIQGTGALFAKNSDRAPNEPQVVEWYPAADHNTPTVRTTYCDVEQVPHTHAYLLSRPTWLWGGEMGVNEHGVCIGNDAVFTRGRYGQTGLLGMDLLRLALTRAATASEAVDWLITLLERYGQGGNAGYDHAFYYDNSYLVVDRQCVFTLETAGREWAVRSGTTGAISNRLSIGTDGDRYSGGVPVDFAARHLEPLYSHFSGSAKRLASTRRCVAGAPDVRGLFSGLRAHDHTAAPLTRPSVTSPCMHAGGLVGDQTTASLVVEVRDDGVIAWVTGASAPCLNLFKPHRLGDPVSTAGGPVVPAGDEAGLAYWLTRERFHRAAIGRTLPAEFYAERDALEEAWVRATRDIKAVEAVGAQARQAETAFFERWAVALPGPTSGSCRYRRYWAKQTARLAVPARPYRTG